MNFVTNSKETEAIQSNLVDSATSTSAMSPISPNDSDFRVLANRPPPSLRSFVKSCRSSRAAVIVVVSLALFVDMLLYDVVVPLLPSILRRVNRSQEDVGVLFAVYAIGLLFATPVFGVWSDKTRNRRLPMLLGQAGLTLSTLLFAYGRSFNVLIGARLLQGVAAAASWTLGLALVTDVFEGDRLGAIIGLVMGFNTLGYFVGPLLGGVAAKLGGIELPFLICATLSFADFAGRLLIKPPKPSSSSSLNLSPTRPRLVTHEDLSVWRMLIYPEMLMTGGILVLSSAAFSAFEALLGDRLEKLFQFDPFQISLIMTFAIVFSIVSSLLIGYLSDLHCRYTLMLICLALHVPAPYFVGISTTVSSFSVAASYFGMVSGALMTPAIPEMAMLVQRLGRSGSSYARIYAYANVCYALGMLAGPIIATGVLDWTGRFGPAINVFSASMTLYFFPFAWVTWRARAKWAGSNGATADSAKHDSRAFPL